MEIEKLFIALGLDADGYDPRVEASTETTRRFVEATETGVSRVVAAVESGFGVMGDRIAQTVESLSGKLTQQNAQLNILQRELALTAERYGEGSLQAEKKQLAIDKLSAAIRETEQRLTSQRQALVAEVASLADAAEAADALSRSTNAIISRFEAFDAQIRQTQSDVAAFTAAVGTTDKIESLTTRLSQQQQELQILGRELAQTSERYGDGSIQAAKKQLAVDKLTTSIRDTTQSIATEQHALLEEKNALTTAAAAADDATKELDQLQDTTEKVRDKTEGAGKSFDVFSEVVTGALRRVGEIGIETAGNVVAGLIDQGRQALMSAGEYQTAQNVFQVTSEATGEQMRRMSALAIQLGDDVSLPGASAKSAADAMIELNRRGIDIENSFSGARGVLQLAAAALDNDVTKAATIGANVLDIYGLKGEQLVDVNDKLVNTFKATGVSIEMQASALEKIGPVADQLNIPLDQTLVMIGELGKKGIEGEEAGTQLRGMFMSLMNPSTQAKEALADLNIEIYDLNGNMKPPIQLIEEFSRVQVGAQVTMRMTADELEKISKKADKLREDIGKLSDKNVELGDKMAEQAARIPAAINEFATKRIQAEQDYHDKLDQLNTQTDQKRTDAATELGRKLEELESTHQNKLVDLVEQANQKREDAERNYGEKVADLATGYQNKLQELETTHQQKVVAIAEQAEQKRTDLDTGYWRKLEDLATSQQQKLNALDESFRAKQVTAAEQYQNTIESLLRAHESRLESIRQSGITAAQNYEQDQLDRARALENKLAAIERAADNKREDAQENYQDTQQDNETSHQRKLADLLTDLQRRQADLQNDYNNATTDAQRAAIQERIRDAQTAYDRAVADENLRYSRQEEDAKAHYDRQLEQIQQQQDRAAEEARLAAEEAQRQADEAYARQQAALATQLAAEQTGYDASRSQALIAYQQELDDLAAQKAAALAAAQEAYAQQQTAAQTAYERQIADLQLALQRQTEAENVRASQAQAAADAAYQQQQSAAQTAYDRLLGDQAIALERQQAAENTAYARSQEAARTSYDQKLVDLQTGLDRQTATLEAAYIKQEQQAKAAFDASMVELQANIAKRQAELQKEIEANNKAFLEARTKLQEYNQTLATHGEHVVTLTQQKIDETKAVIFGRENMAAANIVLGGGVDIYNELLDKVNKSGTAQDLAAASTKGLEGAIAALNNTLDTLKLELGQLGLPVATEYMKTFTQYIIDHKEDIKSFVRESVIPLAEKILAVADGFVKAGDKTAYLKQQIEQNSGPIVTAIGNIAIQAATALGANAPTMAVALLQGLERGLNTALGGVGGSTVVQVLTGGLWGLLTSFWGINSPSTKMIGLAGDLYNGLWNGLSAKAGELGTNIYTWFDQNVVWKMRGLLNTFPDIGATIANSLFGGIRTAWAGLASQLTDLWNQIPQSIRDALQMHSPSRVLVGLGGQAAESVAIGAEKMQGAVADAGRKLGDALTTGVGPLTLDASVSSGSASSGVSANVSSNVNSNVTPAHSGQPDTVEISIPDFKRLAEALRVYFIELKRRENRGFE